MVRSIGTRRILESTRSTYLRCFVLGFGCIVIVKLNVIFTFATRNIFCCSCTSNVFGKSRKDVVTVGIWEINSKITKNDSEFAGIELQLNFKVSSPTILIGIVRFHFVPTNCHNACTRVPKSLDSKFITTIIVTTGIGTVIKIVCPKRKDSVI